MEGSGTGLLLESPIMVKARGVFPPIFPMLVAVFGPTMKLMVSEAAIDRVNENVSVLLSFILEV